MVCMHTFTESHDVHLKSELNVDATITSTGLCFLNVALAPQSRHVETYTRTCFFTNACVSFSTPAHQIRLIRGAMPPNITLALPEGSTILHVSGPTPKESHRTRFKDAVESTLCRVHHLVYNNNNNNNNTNNNAISIRLSDETQARQVHRRLGAHKQVRRRATLGKSREYL